MPYLQVFVDGHSVPQHSFDQQSNGSHRIQFLIPALVVLIRGWVWLWAWVDKVFDFLSIFQVEKTFRPSFSLLVFGCILEEGGFEVISGTLLLAARSSDLHHSSTEHLNYGIKFIFGLGQGRKEPIGRHCDYRS